MKPNDNFSSFENQNSLKMSKNGDFENPKVINCEFSTKSIPERNSTVFSIVRFPGGTKTVLSVFFKSSWQFWHLLSLCRDFETGKNKHILSNLKILDLSFNDIDLWLWKWSKWFGSHVLKKNHDLETSPSSLLLSCTKSLLKVS